MEQRTADRLHERVRDMATRFAFKPNERINEGQLARELGASRTPLREALNRLAAEGFLSFRAGQGFFCRSLEPGGILDLYEARLAVECEGVRLAAERAADAEIAAVRRFLGEIEPDYHGMSSAARLVDLDEDFHLRLVRLCGNRELERILQNLNARSRFIRLIDMETRRGTAPTDHMMIVDSLEARDGPAAAQRMRQHIQRRRDEATEAARLAVSRIYVDG